MPLLKEGVRERGMGMKLREPQVPQLRIVAVGGLGNQLFSVALGLYLLRQQGRAVVLQVASHGFGNISHGSSAIEEFNFDRRLNFVIENQLMSATRLLRTKVLSSFVVSKLFKSWRAVREEKIRDSWSQLAAAGPNLEITGLYQTQQYLMELQESGLMLELRPTIVDEGFDRILEKVSCNDTFCIHIRRGDYLTASGAETLKEEYFEAALDTLGADSNSTVLAFSDSPEGIHEEFKRLQEKYNFTVVDWDGRASNVISIMSQASNLVMSNSTFSWWAAATGRLDKRVAYPAGWKDSLMRANWVAIGAATESGY